MNAKVEKWWKTLESNCFKISNTKTKHVNCNFNRDVHITETHVRIEGRDYIKRSIPILYLDNWLGWRD